MAKNRIRGITVEIGGDVTKLDKALGSTDKKISEIGRDLKDLEQRLKLDPKNVALLDQKFRKLAERSELLANRQKELQHILNTSTVSDVKYEEWTKKQAAFQGQITKTEIETAKLIKRAKELEGRGFAPDSDELVKVRGEIEASQKKADELREAMNAAFEELKRPISMDQYDRLQRELSETTVAASKNQKEYEDMAEVFEAGAGSMSELAIALEEATEDVDDVSDAFDEATEDVDDASGAFEEATDSVRGTGRALSTLGDIAKHAAGELLADAIETVLSSLKDLGAAIWNLDEATEEYRIAQGKLNTAFESAGFGPEAAAKTYAEFYKILGDTDTATEASQLLANLAKDETSLAHWTDIAAGAVGRFGDSLPVESLIEAANEAAKTGEVSGALADAMNWAGGNVELLERSLSLLDDEADRNLVIMADLSSLYGEATESFYKNNEAVIKARENQLQLDDAMATVGETISNIKNSFLNELSPVIANVADKFAELAQRVDWEELADRAGAFIEKIDFNAIFQNIEDFINNIDFDAVFNTIDDIISSLTTLAEVISPAIHLVFSFATKLLDFFRSMSPVAKSMTFAIIGAVFAIRAAGDAISNVSGALKAVDDISGIFSDIAGDKVYRTFLKWATIITLVVLAVTALIAMINVLLGKSKDVSSAMSSIGGVTSGGTQMGAIPRQSSGPLTATAAMLDNYPGFASGGVFAPNNPMLGVLGDNKREYEVAAPESVLKDTFLDALSSSGLLGRTAAPASSRPVVFTLDGRVFARGIIPYLQAQKSLMGINLLDQ